MVDRGGPLRRLHVPMRVPDAGLVMTRRGVVVGLSAAAGSLVMSGPAAADPVKSGTVEIEQVQIAFLASGNLGGGTLHFGGRSYAFQIGGLPQLWNWSTEIGRMALNAEVSRQALTIAYINDFRFMMYLSLLALPLLLLLRPSAPRPAAR